MCSLRQDRRVLVPCFSTSHSPAAELQARAVHQQVQGLAVPARPWAWHLQRLRPAAKGRVVRRGQSEPEQADDGAIRPSVWRRARRTTAQSVSAVKIARGEYQGWLPGVVRGAARHA